MVAPKKGKETPAEQLLRMIEGGSGAVSLSRPSLRRLVAGWFGRAGSRARTWDQADPWLGNIRLAGRLMWLVLAVLGAYTALVLLRPAPVPSLGTTPGAGDGAPSAVAEERPLKPLSEYLSAITTLNPFTGGATQQSPTVPVTETARQRLEGLTNSLIVVGIDNSAVPEAIIEDTEQRRTYFVKVGDEIKGVVIREISPKGVSVSYEGEEILLR